MTVKESEGSAPTESAEGSDERRILSYEGARVPFFVVLIWLTFFVWGVYYLLRWIPESWREWFSAGS